MQAAISPIMRDYLIRFQQTAIKETGRRPLTWLRTPMDEKLVLAGCQRPGYAFWQPIPWKDGNVPLWASMRFGVSPEYSGLFVSLPVHGDLDFICLSPARAP